jgi:hypothetical protein
VTAVLRPLPFRTHATTGCPPHAALALSIAGELREVDSRAVHERLEALADLASWAPVDPFEQLQVLGEVARHDAAPRPVRAATPSDLLIDLVLRDGRGHPALIAVILCEAGRRLGWRTGIVGTDTRLYVAHQDLEQPMLLDPVDGELDDARGLRGPLCWRCSHETSALLLEELARTAERCGSLASAVRALELAAELPFDRGSAQRAQLEVQRMRARLN